MTPKRSGRKAFAKSALADEVAKLQKENERPRKRLWQAERIIEAQKKLGDSGNQPGSATDLRQRFMSTALALRNDVGLMAACDSLSIARSTVYRYQSQSGVDAGDRKPQRCPPLALTDQEKQTVLDVLYSDRFADQAPPGKASD